MPRIAFCSLEIARQAADDHVFQRNQENPPNAVSIYQNPDCSYMFRLALSHPYHVATITFLTNECCALRIFTDLFGYKATVSST
jgi:hypothetical protein